MLLQVAYTFDAGPNACLYLLEESVEEVASLVRYYFPPIDGELETKGKPIKSTLNQVCLIDSTRIFVAFLSQYY